MTKHYFSRLQEAINANWNRPCLCNFRGEEFTFGDFATNIAKLHLLYEKIGLKKGDKVEGTITRITPFGAFVQISPAVEALVHVSELGEGNDIDPEKIFTLNERKEFKVLDIDKEGRKISLSFSEK